MPAALIRQQVGDDVWNSYFKFCVIRNPFEKAISAFEHFGADHQATHAGIKFRVAAFRMAREQRRFFHWLTYEGPPIDRNKYLIEGEFCLDDVIRYEELEAGIARICRRLDLPWAPSLLPTFKGAKRRETTTVDRLYTPASRRVVERKYAYELDRFQYTFPR